MNYRLKNSKGVIYDLYNIADINNVYQLGSFTYKNDSLKLDYSKTKNVFNDGMTQLTDAFLHNRKLVFNIVFATDDVNLFINATNKLTAILWDCKSIISENREAIGLVSSIDISYDKGSHKLSGDISFTFDMLQHGFLDIEKNVVQEAIIKKNNNSVSIVNDGSFIADLNMKIYDIKNIVDNTSIDIYKQENSALFSIGLFPNDSERYIFIDGVNKNVLSIDKNNDESTIYDNDGSISSFDRSADNLGSDFHQLEIGENIFIITVVSDADTTFKIDFQFKQRYAI